MKSAESLPDTSVATEGPDEVTNERSTPTDGPDSEAVGKYYLIKKRISGNRQSYKTRFLRYRFERSGGQRSSDQNSSRVPRSSSAKVS